MNILQAIDKMMEMAADDLVNTMYLGNVSKREEFLQGVEVRCGKKYIKIIKNDSVWGFVVNVEDDKKFKYGDILKAASFSTPARNCARGNVFEEGYSVAWTGPHYN